MSCRTPWWLAPIFVTFASSAHAQAVRSFDAPNDGGSPQAGYPTAPPTSYPNAQTPTFPTAPAAPMAPQAPAQPYAQTYAQQAVPQAASSYLLSPPVLPYREGVDPPEGYVLEQHRNRGLMLGGGLTFGAAYGGGLVYALTKSFGNGTGWLAVPVVGPWGAIKGRTFHCKSDNNVSQKDVDDCVDGALNEVTAITFIAVTGLVQAVGATLFFVGVGDVSKEWVRADLAEVEIEADVGPVSDGYGFTLTGRF